MEKTIKTSGSGHTQTLCWDCANATGGCSWADHHDHTPVDGWDAVETQIRSHSPSSIGQTTTSYIVLDCPEFIRDAKGHGLVRINEQGTRHRKEVDEEAIITAYQSGVRISEIEKATGITDSIIYKVLKDAGIETGKRKPGRKKISASAGWAEAARKRG